MNEWAGFCRLNDQWKCDLVIELISEESSWPFNNASGPLKIFGYGHVS